MAYVSCILLLKFAIREFVNPKIVFLVYINLGLFVGPISSKQPASYPCPHYLVLLPMRLIRRIVDKDFNWRAIDQKDNRSADLFVSLLFA